MYMYIYTTNRVPLHEYSAPANRAISTGVKLRCQNMNSSPRDKVLVAMWPKRWTLASQNRRSKHNITCNGGGNVMLRPVINHIEPACTSQGLVKVSCICCCIKSLTLNMLELIERHKLT